MAAALEVEQLETALPLELTVDKLGIGGVTGLLPTVAVRNASTINSYLDFSDNVFKTTGWTTKYAAMSEVERGHYQRLLNVSALALVVGFRLVAEYHVDNSSGVVGDDLDLFLVTNKRANAELLRQALTNRLEEASGNPGSLKLYADDAITVLKTWTLKDEDGNTVLPAVGTPARRGQAT
jgi:hypothetical protein